MIDTQYQARYNKEEMNKAIEALRQGAVVLFPTELSWVVGCDASNSTAVDKLLSLIQHLDPTALVLIDNATKLSTYVQEVPELAWDLIDMSENPLTIILTGTKNMAEQLNADDMKLAFRVTSSFLAATLCARFRNPIYSIQVKNNADSMQHLSQLVDVHLTYENADPVFLNTQNIIQLDKGNVFKIIR